MGREERIAKKKEEIETYEKHPFALIDVIWKLEYELKQIEAEIFETPFQVVAF